MSYRLPAALALVFTATAFGQENTPVFRATTELVMVDVQVLHSKTGTSTAALQSRDLRVSEDGVSQQILFMSHDEMPLSVVLLFDLTQSVRGVLKTLADGATLALTHFRPDDEVAVMVYAGRTQLVGGFTRDRGETVRAIRQAASMRLPGGAHFNEAMYQTAIQLGQSGNPSNRRVAIWLTDNFPNVGLSVHSEEEAFRALNEQDVTVAPILMKSLLFEPIALMIEASEAPLRKVSPAGDANKYAEATGGVVMHLPWDSGRRNPNRRAPSAN
jgi:VWFA-related protein